MKKNGKGREYWKNRQRLRKIPPILVKWFVGYFSGFVSGFLFCYFYKVLFQSTQFDWKIVTGLFAVLGAIFATVLTYTEKFMNLALEKARYHILDMEYKRKKIDREIVSEKLAKDLLPLIDKKAFHSDTIFALCGGKGMHRQRIPQVAGKEGKRPH